MELPAFRPPSRLVIRLVGGLLMLASLAFLVRAAARADFGALLGAIDGRATALLALLGLGYALALVLLAIAWRMMLARELRAGFADALVVYGLSVFPKYLPGSVFQYASRQALGSRFGWPQIAIAKASVAEIALHLVASLAVLLLLEWLLGLGQIGGLSSIFLALVLAGAVGWLVVRTPAERWRMLVALFAQMLFFFLLVLIAAACASLVGGSPRGAFEAGAVFLLAWLIGFIAPGAPGGIGVREAGVVAFASPILGPGASLLFAAASRVATLAGDALFALAALLVGRFGSREKAGPGQH